MRIGRLARFFRAQDGHQRRHRPRALLEDTSSSGSRDERLGQHMLKLVCLLAHFCGLRVVGVWLSCLCAHSQGLRLSARQSLLPLFRGI